MRRPPPRSTLFPYTTLFRSMPSRKAVTFSGKSAPASRRKRSVHSASVARDRKSTRLNSSHLGISYAVFCLKKKKKEKNRLIHDLLYLEALSSPIMRQMRHQD